MHLLTSALAPSTRIAYRNAIKQFRTFHSQLQNRKAWFPVTVNQLANYISHLFQCKYKPSSINSKVAALGHLHTMANKPNPTNHPIITKMLKGASNSNRSVDTRRPISKEILIKMLRTVPILYTNQYIIRLYSAMILLAFHALLRIGEYTLVNSKKPHTLKLSNISFDHSKVKTQMLINFEHFKHSKQTATLALDSSSHPMHCPVKAMQTYLKIRPKQSGKYLFVNNDHTPVSSGQFGKIFKEIIIFCNLSPNTYKPHSLRIGGATWAHSRNLSDSKIQQMGRWKSAAFKKYIRVNLLSD